MVRGMCVWVKHPFQRKGKIVGSNGNLFRFAQIKAAVTAQAECVSQSVSRYVVAFAHIWHNNAAPVFKKPVIDIGQHQKFVVLACNLRVKVFRHTVQRYGIGGDGTCTAARRCKQSAEAKQNR